MSLQGIVHYKDSKQKLLKEIQSQKKLNLRVLEEMFFKFGADFPDMNSDAFKKSTNEIIECVKSQFSSKFEVQKLYQRITGEKPPNTSEQVLINTLLHSTKSRVSEKSPHVEKVDFGSQLIDERVHVLEQLLNEKSTLHNLISKQKQFIDELLSKKVDPTRITFDKSLQTDSPGAESGGENHK